MPTDEGSYAIGDMAALAGTTPRTVRYYVAQGLLPAPIGVGPGAHYTDGHLARLRLIRRLQRQHQPLSEIRQRLASLDEDQVAELLAQADAPELTAADSALEYVRSVLGSPSRRPIETATLASPAAPTPSLPLAAPAAPGGPAPFTPIAPGATSRARLLRSFAMPRMKDAPAALPAQADMVTAAPEAPAPPAAVGPAPAEQRSQWDRIAITPNIEIHVRRPLGRLENRRVERLITIARQVLREEQP